MTSTMALGVREAHAELTPLQIERRELRPDDVAIAIAYCGICHTDAHYVHNDWGSSKFPLVPGHEIVGHVTAVGSEVTRYKVGERVAVGCLVDSCQHCAPCNEGEEPNCVEGPTPTYNGKDRQTGDVTYGGYAEHIVVRERFVLRVPDALDLRFTGPLLCAGITVWTPLRKHRVGKGSKVAVVGLGGLGHMAVKLAAALGAEVTVVTTSPAKADDARALGAQHVLLSKDPQALKAAASRFSLVIDTIPTRHDANAYLMLLARNGVLALIGALEPLEPIHGALLMMNNRSITGSLMGGLIATQELLDFCAEHGVVPDCEMVEARDINAAFKRLRANDVKYRFVIDMASMKDVTAQQASAGSAQGA